MATILIPLLVAIVADPGWVAPQTSLVNPLGMQSLPPDGALIERLPPVIEQTSHEFLPPALAEPIIAQSPEPDPTLADYYDPFSRQFAYGPMMAQPYRLGFRYYDDGTWQPTAAVRGGAQGSFQNVEWNGSTRYSRRVFDHWIAAWNPGWNTKFWTGPHNVNLPPHIDQLFSDLQLMSTCPGAWNVQLGATPQINSDFMRSLTSSAYIIDIRGVLLYQASPRWRVAMGAAVWDRVHYLIVPYAGAIWTPNDAWEFRVLFPKSRISRHWMTDNGRHIWAYGSWEYQVLASQVDMVNPRAVDRFQIRDQQLLLGLSTQRNIATFFAEAGLVFDRHTKFRHLGPGFGIQDGVMLRTGAWY